MVNVILCDDDALFLSALEKRLLKYQCKIYKYTSLNDVLNSNIIFDIAFLDIELKNNELGFEIVQYIRERNPRCIISFFTNYREYSIDGYQYQAFRYILKSDPEIIIQKRIDETFEEFHHNNKIISGSYKDQKFTMRPFEIYYIETFRHVLTFHSQKGNFELYENIKTVCDELSPCGFFRCHRSYVVNIRYIISLKNDNSFLLNTPDRDVIPIGIKYKESAKSIYLESKPIGGNYEFYY